MLTNSSSAAAATPSRPRWLLAAAVATAAALGACAATPSQTAGRPANEAQSLDDAVASLTTKLLARARVDGAEKRVLVVDPTDVLDRRVDFEPRACGPLENGQALGHT